MRLTPKVTDERMKSALPPSFNSYKEMNDLKAVQGMELISDRNRFGKVTLKFHIHF
jgi:hypothetical protein